jgi:hypothetical protein
MNALFMMNLNSTKFIFSSYISLSYVDNQSYKSLADMNSNMTYILDRSEY